MKRVLVAVMIVALLPISIATARPVGAAAQPGAITWTVDHRAKTITVNARLQIYSGCAPGRFFGCGSAAQPATQTLARNLKAAIERVWSGQSYRCYELIVNVDIDVGRDRGSVPDDRLGVRIDTSPVNIRSHVNAGSSNVVSRWGSDLPEDRIEAANSGLHETIWAERDGDSYTVGHDADNRLVRTENHVAAHEFGHLLGLHDTYVDGTDPATGETISVRREGAPHDLMNDLTQGRLDPVTMERLIGRNRNDLVDGSGNRVRLEDLKCNYVLKVDIRMTGARKEFRADIVATGEIELRELGRPAGTQGGAPITHEGRGNLAYVVTPQPKRNCTFGFEGSGGFPIGARLSVTTPFDASKIVLTLAPKLTGLAKDTLIAWPCGGSRTLRQPVIPLMTAFYTDRLGTEWRITDWDPASGARPAVADGWWSGRCTLNACRESDVFKLSEAP